MGPNPSESLEFQSTLSVRRATDSLCPECVKAKISIHALRKESDVSADRGVTECHISIHALRKESDICCNTISTGRTHFNPRSP